MAIQKLSLPPLAPYETPEALERICTEYNRVIGNMELEPLIAIPIFVHNFLCIHPFNDGNGRMSRLLTTLLLFRNGFIVPSSKDWNFHYRSGFYKGKTNTPTNNNIFWYGVTCTESSVNQAQIAFCADTSSGLIEARRYKNGKTFGAWEYVNPPMVGGNEYHTTERWNGKPVYTALIDCGVFPSASVKTVEHGRAATQIVRYTGSTPYYGCALPYWDREEVMNLVQVFVNKHRILVECKQTTWSDYKCYVQIWYTKD